MTVIRLGSTVANRGQADPVEGVSGMVKENSNTWVGKCVLLVPLKFLNVVEGDRTDKNFSVRKETGSSKDLRTGDG